MGSSEDNTAAAQSTRASHSIRLFILVVIGLQILISLISYPFLPAHVPSSWDLAGHVRGYEPRWLNTLFAPALSIGMYVLLRIFTIARPRLKYKSDAESERANQHSALQFIDRIAAAMVLFFLVIQLTMTALTLGWHVDVSFVTNLSLSLLLIFIGNYMGKLPRNSWTGIKTPWTRASDTVWERTHRLGGWLFVATGVLGIIMGFIPFLGIWGITGLLLLITVWLYIYSYIIYHRLQTAGK